MSAFGEALRVSRNKVGLPLRAAVIFALCLCCRNTGDGELLLRQMSQEGSTRRIRTLLTHVVPLAGTQQGLVALLWCPIGTFPGSL